MCNSEWLLQSFVVVQINRSPCGVSGLVPTYMLCFCCHMAFVVLQTQPEEFRIKVVEFLLLISCVTFYIQSVWGTRLSHLLLSAYEALCGLY